MRPGLKASSVGQVEMVKDVSMKVTSSAKADHRRCGGIAAPDCFGEHLNQAGPGQEQSVSADI
jgi:hypothetical protein